MNRINFFFTQTSQTYADFLITKRKKIVQIGAIASPIRPDNYRDSGRRLLISF